MAVDRVGGAGGGPFVADEIDPVPLGKERIEAQDEPLVAVEEVADALDDGMPVELPRPEDV